MGGECNLGYKATFTTTWKVLAQTPAHSQCFEVCCLTCPAYMEDSPKPLIPWALCVAQSHTLTQGTHTGRL